MFRGVKIGEVTKMMIYSNRSDPSKRSFEIPVILEIEEGNIESIGPEIKDEKQYFQALIKSGLRAQLQMQSLVTGQLMINIDFYPNTPVRLVGAQQIDLARDVTELPTIQTPMQKLGKTLEDIPLDEIAKSASKSLKAIEALVTSEDLTKSLNYLKQTLKDFRDLAHRLNEIIGPLSADLGQTLKDARVLIRNVDRQVDPLATSLRKTSDSAGDALKDARGLINNLNGEVKKIAADLASILQKAGETLASVNGAVEEGSPLRYQIETTIGELARAARSIRILADYIERHPDALLRGRPETGGQ
jgi:paraquat-inducible protein B